MFGHFPSGHEELEYGKNDYKAYVKDIKKALKIKKELPDKNIWAYSGYLYEDFLPGGKVYCEASEPFLSMIDVMVDGPFILEKKDISLNFRGSSNQRIIDVPETRKNQEIVLLME